MEIVAAGQHNVLLIGPPGSGKSMLLQRLPSIMPQLTHAEAPDVRFVHWLIWNLPSATDGLPERVATTTELAVFGPDTLQGTNDDKVIGYSGPCPLPVTDAGGQHVDYRQTKLELVFEYLFHVYALDTMLGLPGGATKGEFLQAIDGHILSGGVIKGEFVASKQINWPFAILSNDTPNTNHAAAFQTVRLRPIAT